MIRKIKSMNKGITFVEILVSVLILGIVLSAMLGSFVIGRTSINKVKHRLEAMNLVSAMVESLRDLDYTGVASIPSQNISIDIGPDLVRDTADDLVGSIAVVVQDINDIDGDGNTAEDEIDITGDGNNDSCKPVYVTISWNERSMAGSRMVNEQVVTFIGH